MTRLRMRGRMLAVAGLLAAAWPAMAADNVVEVQLDKARVIRMPPHAATIVVGNPIIADVTTLRDGLVVVTGKGFGETNLIFLDGAGAALQEASVRVSGVGSGLTVQRGMDRESYSCLPRCQPTVTLGDADGFLKNAASQITSRNGMANTASH